MKSAKTPHFIESEYHTRQSTETFYKIKLSIWQIIKKLGIEKNTKYVDVK